jgi:tripartite-type tricarboxylate transporter receptor subunit TctC
MRSIVCSIIAISVLSATGPAVAQATYPQRPIRLIFGFPAGNDAVPRIYADKLGEALGRPIIFENVTGAGGNIAADRVAKAAPDGYTIGILGNANIVINVMLYRQLPYNPKRDLIPISLIYSYANVLVVNKDVPVRSVQDLVSLARARPGKLIYGHNGTGTTTHLSAEIVKTMAHVDLLEVPYRGPSPVLTDLLSGRITMSSQSPSNTLALVRDGKIRGLAVTSLKRSQVAPDLPTMDESGFPGFETTVWYGLFAPTGTPSSVVDQLGRETVRIMSSEEMRKKVLALGQVPVGSTSAESADIIQGDFPYWERVIKEAGVKSIE